jgi:capsular polysaccharide biosynthesis protein
LLFSAADRARLWARLSWVPRRSWVALVAVLLTVSVAWAIARVQHEMYTAEAVLIVPSGSKQGAPGNANEANRLARTYASLIPNDDRVRQFLMQNLALTSDDIEKNLTVSNDAETSLVRIVYRDQNARRAVQAARLLADSVTGASPVSPTIAPKSMIVADQPERAVPEPSPSRTAVPIGVVLGLCLGGLAVVILERADARVDTAAALSAETTCPVSKLEELSTWSMVAMLERWRALANSSSTWVALIPASNGLNQTVVALGRHIYAEGRSSPFRVELSAVSAGRTTDDDRLTIILGGAPGGEEAGETVAVACDLTVLVVAEGTAVKDVRSAIAVLEQYGVSPQWALLMRRVRRRRGHRDYASVPAVAAEPP